MNQKTGAIINLPHSVEIIRIVFYCFVSRAEDNLARGFVLSPLSFKFNLLLQYSKENVFIHFDRKNIFRPPNNSALHFRRFAFINLIM